MSTEWPPGYERRSRLKLATIGRRTGRRHLVTIDFVVHDGRLFVTGAKMGRDWMKNALKNPEVVVTIDGASKRMSAELINSEEMRGIIEKLYRKKYPFSSRFLRLARKGALIFELKEQKVEKKARDTINFHKL